MFVNYLFVIYYIYFYYDIVHVVQYDKIYKRKTVKKKSKALAKQFTI